jgi:regulator of cell morphogenesis and NO signaling
MHARPTNPTERTLTELIAYLLNHHHPYTKSALEELAPLLDKVLRVHAEEHAELRELHKLFTELRDDMGMHLMKEENILFPYMLALESGTPPAAHFGTVANPIRMMTMEHEHDNSILNRMCEITGNFALPAGACASYTALYAGLHELVDDLFRHMELENNFVFPKAIATEKNIREQT